MDGVGEYVELAHCIVHQAVDDYRVALKCIHISPQSRTLLKEIDEIESFFLSSWFESLTSIDGKKLLIMLNQEVKE